MILLGIGLLGVAQVGADAAFGAGVLLGIAVFLLVFVLLLLVPRLRRDGMFSFRLVVPASVDEVEAALREALGAAGRTVRVEVVRSRAPNPPRLVITEGVPARFLLGALSRRESGDRLETTEVVQIGIRDAGDEGARQLRDLVSGALAPGSGPSG